jgi:hypothetical protein
MLKLYTRIQDAIKNVHRKDEAQDGFEYLLVIGAIMVAVVVAIAAGGAGPVAAVWADVSAELTSVIT